MRSQNVALAPDTPNLVVPDTPNLDFAPDTPNLVVMLKDRHPQLDLFVCDVADVILKDLMPQMEHPFYTLSKNPVYEIREYQHGPHWLRISPGVHGLATIYDKDILIYAVSQLMAAKGRGEDISPRIQINTYDFLVFANRNTGGKDYASFVKSLERLRGITITTNIRTGNEEQTDIFGLIDSASIRRKNGLDGRLLSVELELSKWVFNAIKSNEVLSMSRDYFRLSRPYERRAYEIARKHCGHAKEWVIGLDKFHSKMGTVSEMKRFRQQMRDLSERDSLPEYHVMLMGPNLIFRARDQSPKPTSIRPNLQTQTFETAKRYTLPHRADVYDWFEQWVMWWQDLGCPELKSPDGAFLGFCAKKAEKLGSR